MNATAYKSLAEGLPPEVAKQIHPDWYKNEAAYWAVRDSLVGQFENQWVAFSDGTVVASGRRPSQVHHAANAVDVHAFVACVGREHEPLRMRRVEFAYDSTYPGEPLPVIRAEVRTSPGVGGVILEDLILDTGSDTCALRWSDHQQLQLDTSIARAGVIGGVGGSLIHTLEFSVWIAVDGSEHPCQVHFDPTGDERILGRDFLNQLDVLFRGPAAEVIINP